MKRLGQTGFSLPTMSFEEAFPINNSMTFLNKIKERERNLKIEREKLDLAWKKIYEDQKFIETSLQRIEQTKEEINTLSLAENDNNEISTSFVLKNAQCELQNLYNLLQADFIVAEKELHDQNLKNKHEIILKKEEIEIYQHDMNKIQSLIGYIQNNLVNFENQVLEIELKAEIHQQKLNENNDQKSKLIKRKITVQSEKERLMRLLKKKETEINDLSQKLEKTQNIYRNVEDERSELLAEEDRLSKEEKVLEVLRENINELQTQLNDIKNERIQKENLLRNNRVKVKNVIPLTNTWNTSDHLDLNLISQMNEENELQQKKELLDIQINQSRHAWNEKINSLKQSIRDFEESIDSEKGLNGIMNNMNNEIINLQQSINDKKKELLDLQAQIVPEEELKKRVTTLTDSFQNLVAQETKMNLQLRDFSHELDEVEFNEKSIRFSIEECEDSRKVLETQAAALNKKMELCNTNLISYQDRYNKLLSTLNQLKGTL